jgi:hypothetical protein
MKVGQINRGSDLGEKIYRICTQDNVRNIVEIGTWNGMGSTKCIYDAVIGTSKHVWSLECNRLRHEEAKVNLGLLPPNFKLLHGTIVTAEELTPILETLDNETLKGWLKEDIAWIQSTPNVIDSLPEKIDLCIIDGGEFSGDIEFFRLWERCKYIILDDTNAIKHKKTKEFILSKPDKLKVIEDNIVERNGFLICEVL